MGKLALVLEAHHTTYIEGSQLTLDQAERPMAGESVPEADPTLLLLHSLFAPYVLRFKIQD